MDQELLTLPKHLISSPVFNGDGVARSFVFCVLFCLSLSVLLAIVFSVLLRFSASYYLFVYRCLFFWPLCSLSFFGFRLLITSLVSLTFFFFFFYFYFFRHFQNIYITNTDITQQHRQRHYLYIHFQYKHMKCCVPLSPCNKPNT